MSVELVSCNCDCQPCTLCDCDARDKTSVSFKDALKIVTDNIKSDADLYRGYKDNISMAMYDAYRNSTTTDIHKISNAAAEAFLTQWCKY